MYSTVPGFPTGKTAHPGSHRDFHRHTAIAI